MKSPNVEGPTTRTHLFRVPILGGFYDERDKRLIADASALRYVTVALCIICLSVGVFQLTSGLTNGQEVTNVISSATRLPDYTCKSLGQYSGTTYGCMMDPAFYQEGLCNPALPPVNCAGGVVACPANVSSYFFDPPAADGRTASSTSGWQVVNSNMHFETYEDCLATLPVVLNATAAMPPIVPTGGGYVRSIYNGNLSIGGVSAQFFVEGLSSFGFPPNSSLFDMYTRSFFALQAMPPATSPWSCGVDASNYFANGSVIPGSSIDIFLTKYMPKNLLTRTKSPYCVFPAPALLCNAYYALGPYTCSKTTQIRQTWTQVLGSSIANAWALLGALTTGVAFVIKRCCSAAQPVPQPATVSIQDVDIEVGPQAVRGSPATSVEGRE